MENNELIKSDELVQAICEECKAVARRVHDGQIERPAFEAASLALIVLAARFNLDKEVFKRLLDSPLPTSS